MRPVSSASRQASCGCVWGRWQPGNRHGSYRSAAPGRLPQAGRIATAHTTNNTALAAPAADLRLQAAPSCW